MKIIISITDEFGATNASAFSLDEAFDYLCIYAGYYIDDAKKAIAIALLTDNVINILKPV